MIDRSRINNLKELTFDLCLEVGRYLINLSELSKCPATILSSVINARYPISFHGGFFFFCIFTSITLYLDNQMKQIVIVMTVINQHYKVGNIFTHFRAVAIWYLKTQIVVFDIRFHARM